MSHTRGSGIAGDLALLLARLTIGSFLIHGVWDNIVSTARMAEFTAFLARHEFPAASLLAPLSVGVQFVAGAGLVVGFKTRWAGLLVAANFVVALVMVDAVQSVRGAYPAVSLIAFGLIFYAIGGGRLAIDGRYRRR